MTLTIIGIGRGTMEDWGLIPSFLDETDPRSAKEQFNEKYVSGWQAFEGFTLDKKDMSLTYPEDPPYYPLGTLFFRGEMIVLYPHGWVMIMNVGDDTVAADDIPFEVCRMD